MSSVGRVTVERAFVIVDLAGFTAATEAHGDETAADLATQLTRFTTEALGPGDQLVKSLGDAVLCACADPDAAVALLVAIFDAARDVNGLLLLRGGAHQGSAVEREGDFFGTGVNIAARVADSAAGGHVHATVGVADAARRAEIEVVELGAYSLHNVADEVTLYELVIETGDVADVVDPVCRMRVGRNHAQGRLRHADVEYWFCSLECVAAFAASPQRYVYALD